VLNCAEKALHARMGDADATKLSSLWVDADFQNEVCAELLNLKATAASYQKNREQMRRTLNALSAEWLTKKKVRRLSAPRTHPPDSAARE
jgi:hypothetical protein